MQSSVGRLKEPCEHILICRIERTIAVAPPEAFSQVMDRTLYLAFYPWRIRRAESRVEPVVVGKPGELDVEDRSSVVPFDHHMLHAVVKDFFRDAAEIREGVDVTVHESFEGPLLHEFDIHGP